jgi:hypothetical protein
MDTNESVLDDGRESCATGEVCPFPGSCYIGPAPVTEVLFDQLEYLLSHGGAHCGADCMDCLRLAQIEKLLLLPFSSALLTIADWGGARRSAA